MCICVYACMYVQMHVSLCVSCVHETRGLHCLPFAITLCLDSMTQGLTEPGAHHIN